MKVAETTNRVLSLSAVLQEQREHPTMVLHTNYESDATRNYNKKDKQRKKCSKNEHVEQRVRMKKQRIVLQHQEANEKALPIP